MNCVLLTIVCECVSDRCPICVPFVHCSTRQRFLERLKMCGRSMISFFFSLRPSICMRQRQTRTSIRFAKHILSPNSPHARTNALVFVKSLGKHTTSDCVIRRRRRSRLSLAATSLSFSPIHSSVIIRTSHVCVRAVAIFALCFMLLPVFFFVRFICLFFGQVNRTFGVFFARDSCVACVVACVSVCVLNAVRAI